MSEDVFMIFGLGFFLFVIYMITKGDRESYERRRDANNLTYARKLDEAREFGFQGSRLERDAKEPHN